MWKVRIGTLNMGSYSIPLNHVIFLLFSILIWRSIFTKSPPRSSQITPTILQFSIISWIIHSWFHTIQRSWSFFNYSIRDLLNHLWFGDDSQFLSSTIESILLPSWRMLCFAVAAGIVVIAGFQFIFPLKQLCDALIALPSLLALIRTCSVECVPICVEITCYLLWIEFFLFMNIDCCSN